MSERLYTTTDIDRQFHLPRSRVKNWLARGFQPSITKTSGQGYANRFTIHDVNRLIVIEFLIDVMKMKLSKALELTEGNDE